MIDLCQQISLPAPLRVLKSRGGGVFLKAAVGKTKRTYAMQMTFFPWEFSEGSVEDQVQNKPFPWCERNKNSWKSAFNMGVIKQHKQNQFLYL